MSKRSSGQIAALTGLRAVAALWVVLVHVEIAHPAGAPYWADLILGSFGTLPVVFFFALSGFILSVVYAPRLEETLFSKNSVRNYGWARFARIIPVYVASITPALLMLAWRLTVDQRVIDWPYTQILVRFQETGGSTLDYLLRANIPAWSLLAEVIFYLIFPTLLRKYLALSDKGLWKGLAWSLGGYFALQSAFMVAYFTVPGWWGNFLEGTSHFGPPVFIPIFSAGMLLGLIYHRGLAPKWVTKWSTAVYGLLALVVLGSALYRSPVLPVAFISAIIAPIFCLAILAGTGDTGVVNKLMCTKPLQILGVASYSIYITHWPVRDMLQPLLAQTPLREAPVLMGWVLIAILTFVGYLAYSWIEKPLQKWVMAKAHRPEPAPGLIGAAD